MSWSRAWSVIAPAAAVLMAVGVAWFAAGENQEIEPGVCVVLGSDSRVTVVGCNDPDAQFEVVSFAGVSTPVAPAGCEVGEPYRIFLPGESSGAKPVWCLVDVDDDSAELRKSIEEVRT